MAVRFATSIAIVFLSLMPRASALTMEVYNLEVATLGTRTKHYLVGRHQAVAHNVSDYVVPKTREELIALTKRIAPRDLAVAVKAGDPHARDIFVVTHLSRVLPILNQHGGVRPAHVYPVLNEIFDRAFKSHEKPENLTFALTDRATEVAIAYANRGTRASIINASRLSVVEDALERTKKLREPQKPDETTGASDKKASLKLTSTHTPADSESANAPTLLDAPSDTKLLDAPEVSDAPFVSDAAEISDAPVDAQLFAWVRSLVPQTTSDASLRSQMQKFALRRETLATQLGAREAAVAILMAEGLGRRRIANKLSLRFSTARLRMEAARRKLRALFGVSDEKAHSQIQEQDAIAELLRDTDSSSPEPVHGTRDELDARARAFASVQHDKPLLLYSEEQLFAEVRATIPHISVSDEQLRADMHRLQIHPCILLDIGVLSEKEAAVATLMARGMGRARIARALGIDPDRARSFMQRATRLLTNYSQKVAQALQTNQIFGVGSLEDAFKPNDNRFPSQDRFERAEQGGSALDALAVSLARYVSSELKENGVSPLDVPHIANDILGRVLPATQNQTASEGYQDIADTIVAERVRAYNEDSAGTLIQASATPPLAERAAVRLLREHGPKMLERELAPSAARLLLDAFVVTRQQAYEATEWPSLEEELSRHPYGETVSTVREHSVSGARKSAFQRVLKASPVLAFAEDELFAEVRKDLSQPGLSAQELHQDLVALRFTPDEMQRAQVLNAKERWVLASQAQGRKGESIYSTLVPHEVALKGFRQSGSERIRKWIRNYSLTQERAEAARRLNPAERNQQGQTILNAWKTVNTPPTDSALVSLAKSLSKRERAALILLRGHQWRADEIATLDSTWFTEGVQTASARALAKVRQFVEPGIITTTREQKERLRSIALLIAQLPPSSEARKP